MNSLVGGNWTRRHSTTFFISAILRDQKREHRFFSFLFWKKPRAKREKLHPIRTPPPTHTHGPAVTYGSLILEIRSLEGSDRTVFGLTSVESETSCTVTGGNVFIKVIRLAVERNIPWHNAAAFYRSLYSREWLHQYCLILYLVK
jgi:hypothetical protein